MPTKNHSLEYRGWEIKKHPLVVDMWKAYKDGVDSAYSCKDMESVLAHIDKQEDEPNYQLHLSGLCGDNIIITSAWDAEQAGRLVSENLKHHPRITVEKVD